MKRGVCFSLAGLLLACTNGCALIRYDECRLVYSLRNNAEGAHVSIYFMNVRMPDDPDGKVPDQKEQYRAYTDQRIGALPKAFAQLLCAAEHTSHFPEYDKLPGAAYIGSGDAGVSFASSLLGAFNGWEYSLLKKGKRCAYTFEPTAKCAEELGGTPWDWFCILPACKVVEHNADETDGKTGELRWKVERGKRKTKIAFTTEAVENMKRGGW